MNTQELIRLGEYVNHFIFKNIWGEPRQEYRHNLRLSKYGNRVYSNIIQLEYNTTIRTPVNDEPFKIYRIPRALFGGIAINMIDWVNLYDFLKDKGFDLRLHSDCGEWMYRKACYIRRDPNIDAVLFAVQYSMMDKVMLDVESEMYCAPYVEIPDYSQGSVFDIDAFIVTNNMDRTLLVNNINNSSIAYINGRFVRDVQTTQVSTGDYVELVSLDDELLRFDVDIAIDDDNRVYISDIDNRMRHLIRYPEKLLDISINHNLVELFVIPRNISDNNIKGLFLHRAQGEGNSIFNVTRNTLSIPHYILVDYMSKLNVDEVTIHCIYRKPKHDDITIYTGDEDYTEYLDTLDHDTIMDFLEGKNDEYLEFWNAKHLDKSEYTKCFTYLRHEISLDMIPYYLEVFGYYSLISVVCKNVISYNNPSGKYFNMDIPVLYNQSSNIRVLVFLDGLYIDEEDYTVSVSDKVYVTFDNDVGGDNITFLLLEENGGSEFMLWVPNENNDTIELPLDDVTVKSFDTSLDIDNGIVKTYPDSNSVTLTAFPTLYNKDLLLQPLNPVVYIKKDIGPDVEVGRPICINITGSLHGTSTIIAPPEYTSYLVILDGKLLVRDVDYEVYIGPNMFKSNGLPLGTNVHQILLHTKNVTTTSEVVVYCIEDYITKQSYGFIGDPDNTTKFWRTGLSVITVDGKTHGDKPRNTLVSEAPNDMSYPGVVNGQLYNVSTVLPRRAVKVIKPWSSGEEDDSKFEQILNYFNSIKLDEDVTVHIPDSYHVTSLFLTEVIFLWSENMIELQFDPYAANMIHQIPELYALYMHDKEYREKQDLRFVDISPHYVDTIGGSDIMAYRTIGQLVRGVLVSDPIHGETTLNI